MCISSLREVIASNYSGKFSGTNRVTLQRRSRQFQQIVHVGIIDFLQKFDFKKKTEHKFKSWSPGVNPSALSCVEPKLYMHRFINFMEKEVVKQDLQEDHEIL